MNRTQKSALFNLVIFLLCIGLGVFVLIEIVLFKTIHPRLRLFFLVFMIVAFVFGLIFIFKKQSPKEVESDERDKLIQLRAALAGSVSGWILLAAATLACRFAVGIKGNISVWTITLINMVAFLFAMMAYSIAILIQYGRGGKGELS